MTLEEFWARVPKFTTDYETFECGDCGFQSDDWPEFVGHSRQWHLKEPKTVAA